VLNLRRYQSNFVLDIQAAWETVRSVLGVLPTGAGKTVCFSSVMHDHRGAAAAVVHRKEIVGQISQSLARLDVPHRIIAPPSVVTRIRRKHLKEFGKSFVDPHAQAGVISVQTMTSPASGRNRELQRWLGQITLAVFDEGHHYVRQGLWARAVDSMENARLLFVTATPDRADGKGLGEASDGFAQTLVEGPHLQGLIDQGYLAPFTYKAPTTDLDVSGLAVTASGDLNTKALRKRVVESHLVGDVVRHYKQFADGKRAIVFATDVETANDMADAFEAAGIPSAALSGESEQGDRDHKLDLFDDGRLKVLVNVDLFDEGFDVPGVDAVILARPTESLAKYLQMVGRSLRVVYAAGSDLATADGRRAAIAASDKPNAIIIDPVRNWERHGMPNWPRKWTLDGKQKGTRPATDTVPQRVCDSCTQPYERFYAACPFCGHVPEPAGRYRPEQVDGDLMELDVDGMARLFAAMQYAELDEDTYAKDQIGRGIPAIGRGPDMKRHREARYRRSVLRELVAWWTGMQPAGRELAEKHRRFFHRFGIDIGTAFTLSAKDTDALIERIKERFAEDMT
jgi:superfamily II DNA or RNA helicase